MVVVLMMVLWSHAPWKDGGFSTNHNDCRNLFNTNNNNAALAFANNRYSINSWSHIHITGDYSSSVRICIGTCYYYNNSEMFNRFVAAVNSQDNYKLL